MGSLVPTKDRKAEKGLRMKKDLVGESGDDSIV